MDLLLATHNPHKVREFSQLLGKNFKLFDLTAFPEIAIPKETGATFEENAILKAKTASPNLPNLVIADDSGLEVDALGGAPGIFSARYAGQNASDAENVSKLLHALSALKISRDMRLARFRCLIALARNGKVLGTFEGVVEGTIVDPPRGSGGFGYDPVFQPKGSRQTFAEMAAEMKNEISHRARAIAALREGLRRIEN